jgi:ubiquinone/menaquinone biosynthesis C-methylase UbiE
VTSNTGARIGTEDQKCTYERSEIHERWEAIYRKNPHLDRLNEKMLDRILRVLQVPSNAVFLDAGCGTADHSIRIAKRGFRCIGVDISEGVLAQAAKNVVEARVQEQVELHCHALDKLPFVDGSFDVIHCRGVLMHIPDWEVALRSLCRVLKPGGGIVILENNQSSLELLMVRVARLITSRESAMVKTQSGLEFWSDEAGTPFVVRYANVSYLKKKLQMFGIRPIATFGTRFIDVGRLPPYLRSIGAKLNYGWVRLRLPASISGGSALIGVKQ